ncbi:MAG: bifunctional riboflavin kinase/FAD synthetase [Candidatus Omnitrophota bacterium]
MTDLNFHTLKPDAADPPGSVVAIGNFDGFHLGHRRIVDTLKRLAVENHLRSVIVTFFPNPKVYFNPGFHLIDTYDQKKRKLEEQGVDEVSIIDFNRVVDLSDDQFLHDVLIEQYRMNHMVMGENFRFGKGRVGDLTFLKEASRHDGFGMSVVDALTVDGVRVSSSLIRNLLSDGKIEESNRMLGRRYVIEGIIAEGDKMGRQLGFPTINIATENTLLPDGVFKTTVEIDDDRFCSIAYIGYRPTFKGNEKRVEAHIFNFDRDVYGKKVKLYFEKKIRGEMTFDSQNSLINQIKKDISILDVDKEHIF